MNMEEKQEKVDGDSSGQAMKRKFQPKHFNVFWLYSDCWESIYCTLVIMRKR